MIVRNLLDAQHLAVEGVLYAPDSFMCATLDELMDHCNGCGAAGSWFRPPSKMYGTEIVTACIIHDWMYSMGSTIDDKDEADRVFLNNMQRLIERDRHKWYKPTALQHRRALKYYWGVKYGGGSAFWKDKSHT